MKIAIKKEIIVVPIILGLFLSLTLFVLATPTGPQSIDVGESSRGTIIPATQVEAQAGNVTELTINASFITNTWQGYYGNISGSIKLDNANNWTLYDWNLATPSGKVYATRNNTGIDWNSIVCANAENISAEDTYLESTGYPDAVNETFTGLSSSFYVGDTPLSNCPATNLYVNDTAQSSLFEEALLLDGSKDAIIYTSLIEPSQTGFDNRTHDFQLIVGEHGRNGDTQTTAYYFYVELG